MISYLDRIRLINGGEALKDGFRELCKINREKAVSLINDERLGFATLFTLLPEIEGLGQNKRNTIAMDVCKKILEDKNHSLSSENSEEIISALKWMLITGASDDGLSSEFDRIIDGTASLLINTYNDKTILKLVADLIFKRNRAGAFIHDLVWAFFRAKHPSVLNIAAEYLRSGHKADIDLVYKLLNIEPENNYRQYALWLKQNYNNITFTGESFNLTSNPQPISVDLGGEI